MLLGASQAYRARQKSKSAFIFVRIVDPRSVELPQDGADQEDAMDTTYSSACTEESDSEPAVQPQVGLLLRPGFLLWWTKCRPSQHFRFHFVK